MTLDDAIHRMTGMAAEKFHLRERGFVREGSFADLVIFDPAKIPDTATYADPRRYPAGSATCSSTEPSSRATGIIPVRGRAVRCAANKRSGWLCSARRAATRILPE